MTLIENENVEASKSERHSSPSNSEVDKVLNENDVVNESFKLPTHTSPRTLANLKDETPKEKSTNQQPIHDHGKFLNLWFNLIHNKNNTTFLLMH